MSGQNTPVDNEAGPNEKPAEEKAPVPIWRNLWVISFVLGAAFITLMRPMTRHVPDPPKVKFELPEYSLTNQDGEAFGTKDLKGKVHVVSFFFTSCQTICPKVIGAMTKLQEKYDHNKIPVQLVSITVDPDNDTPEKLKEYAQKIGANHARWNFLTGSWEKVNDLIVKGYKTHMGKEEADDAGIMDIGHGAHLVLVDEKSGVRGIYDTTDSGIDEIFHRSTHVLRVIRQQGSCSIARHLH